MSNSDTVVVMDQFSSSKDARSASVVHSGQLGAVESKTGQLAAAQVQLVERPVQGMLMLRASAIAQMELLSKALQEHCGVALPERLDSSIGNEYCIRWMSPDAWLLTCPLDNAFSIETKLREAVNGHIAIVNVSGGYTVFELSDTRALDVLKKCTGYDTHPDNFGTGKVVNTTFAKAQVTLRAVRTGDKACYEIIVRRSFSDYLWIWLQRAAFEYGLEAVAVSDVY